MAFYMFSICTFLALSSAFAIPSQQSETQGLAKKSCAKEFSLFKKCQSSLIKLSEGVIDQLVSGHIHTSLALSSEYERTMMECAPVESEMATCCFPDLTKEKRNADDKALEHTEGETVCQEYNLQLEKLDQAVAENKAKFDLIDEDLRREFERLSVIMREAAAGESSY